MDGLLVNKIQNYKKARLKTEKLRELMKQLFFYILPLLVVLMGCHDDHEGGYYPSPSQGGEVRVPFNISMPSQLPKTYALDDNDENDVKNIDILAFKVNGGQETFAYRTQAEQGSIVDDGVNNKKKFIVTLFKDGSQAYRFVAVANAKEQLDNTFPGGIAVGTAKDAVMSQLELTGINKWNVDNSTEGYLPIPMWGETLDNIVIQDNTVITDLKLLRMVAKINVKIDPSITEAGFALSSVSLYNYYSAGRIAPDAANLVSGSRSTVEKPTVIGTTTKGPIDYEGSGLVANNSIINNIYTFESVVPKNGSEVDLSKVTTLVIGGKYNNSGTISYYRLDIANGKNYQNILRNHLYTINITKVKSAGYSTKEEAFNSRPINIEAEVVVWDDANIEDIKFDGQFMLAVSQRKFDLSKGAYGEYSDGNTVSITTDYKSNDGTVQGWKVVSIVDAEAKPITDWLKTSVSKGDANVTTDMKLLLTENSSGQDRKGFVHISAGRITQIIEVSQNLVPPLELSLINADGKEITELLFNSQDAGVAPEGKQFTALWMPIDRECDVMSARMGSTPLFSFGTGSHTPGQGAFVKTSGEGKGKQIYNIVPAPFTQTEINENPLIEKISRIDFVLTNGVGFITKSIQLRQLRYGLLIVANDFYTLDGTEQTIRLKSNSLWRVKSVEDPSNLLVSFNMNQNGGYNTGEGDPLVLTLRQAVEEEDVKSFITFTFYDPNGKYDDVSLTINPVACGMDGIAIPLPIGKGSYLTHKYGDKCWMVENSREGTPNFTFYGESGFSIDPFIGFNKPSAGTKNYYYSNSSRDTACPKGWHIPTVQEAGDLVKLVNADSNSKVTNGTKGAQWWAGPGASVDLNTTAFTGALLPNYGEYEYRYYWGGWTSFGYWWYDTTNSSRMLRGSNTAGSFVATTSPHSNKPYLPVRCVQD